MGDVIEFPEPRRGRVVRRREPAQVIDFGQERLDRREAVYARKMTSIASRVREMLDEADELRAEYGTDAAEVYAQRARDRKKQQAQ